MKKLLLLVILICLTSVSSWGQIKMCLEKSRPTTKANLSNPKLGQSIVSAGKGSNILWENGSTLKIKFIGGNDYVKGKVKKYATEWTNYVNLTFDFVETGYAHIRISFEENGFSHSHVGRNSILYAAQSEASMNFGWFNYSTPEEEFSRTILHEFGHALGFYHEHQHPTNGIPWDETAVYKFYAQPPNSWDKATTKRNVIDRFTSSETQYTAYDPHSIMHYPIDNDLTIGDYEVGENYKLSQTDINFAKVLYPGKKMTGNTDVPILKCRNSEIKIVNSSVTITVSDVLDKLQAPDPYSITKSSVNPSTFTSPGDYLVTVSATSSNGQTSSCTASVKILKQEANTGPKIACKNYTTYLKQGGVHLQGFELLDIEKCGYVSTVSLSQNTFTSEGTYPVVLTAYGNQLQGTSKCQVYVTISNSSTQGNTCNYYYENFPLLKSEINAKFKLSFYEDPALYYVNDTWDIMIKDNECNYLKTGCVIYTRNNDARFKWEFVYAGFYFYIDNNNVIYDYWLRPRGSINLL